MLVLLVSGSSASSLFPEPVDTSEGLNDEVCEALKKKLILLVHLFHGVAMEVSSSS